MPLSRAALYAQGEDLHIAMWPGNLRNTDETTRFLAREGRSFVLAVSSLLLREDVPANSPAAAMLDTCRNRVGRRDHARGVVDLAEFVHLYAIAAMGTTRMSVGSSAVKCLVVEPMRRRMVGDRVTGSSMLAMPTPRRYAGTPFGATPTAKPGASLRS